MHTENGLFAEADATGWSPLADASTTSVVSIVADVMTAAPMAVGPKSSVLQLVHIFHAKQFRHLLVTETDGRLLGIVSDRDVGRCFGPSGRPDEASLEAIRTEDVMSRDVITIDRDATLTAAIDLMYEQGVSCLPVVSGERLVGIITTTDMLRLLRRMLSS